MWKLASSEPGSLGSQDGPCKGMYPLQKDTVVKLAFTVSIGFSLEGKVEIWITSSVLWSIFWLLQVWRQYHVPRKSAAAQLGLRHLLASFYVRGEYNNQHWFPSVYCSHISCGSYDVVTEMSIRWWPASLSIRSVLYVRFQGNVQEKQYLYIAMCEFSFGWASLDWQLL